MKRVVQTRTGDDGNCFAACLASIFGWSIKDVPDWNDEEDFIDQVNDYLHGKGMRYKRIPIDSAKPNGYSTIEGISPRGGLHACVAEDGELTWDPHPIEDGTGQGLVEPRYYGVFERLTRSYDSAVVAGFTMQFNSATTWDSASPKVRRAWLIANGFNKAAADYVWNEQPSNVSNAFVNWYRSNHNV